MMEAAGQAMDLAWTISRTITKTKAGTFNMKTNLVRIDGKVYAKTLTFGNQKTKTVFKNRKKYDRNKEKLKFD
jgi:hypothetical protein